MAPRQPITTPEPTDADFDAHVTGIAALAEPVRRDLYRYVIAQAGPVNRDQVAAGAGVARHVAKFHLDKLVEDGLLEVGYARPPGRSGPGAGRPAKFYRRSSRELAVSLPQRDYALAGRLLARAITEAQRDDSPIDDALHDVAREAGRNLGQLVRDQAGPRPSRSVLLAVTTNVLRASGYEPRPDAAGITLANCPFHALAQDFTDLVCGMNLEFMGGLVDGLDGDYFQARLEPTPGQCCVHLQKADHPRSTRREERKATA